MKSNKLFSKRQTGLTLIEVMSSLAILAVVIGGALALFVSASTRQTINQFSSDLSSVRSVVRSVYFGQGGYGTASLNPILIASKSVPQTMTVAGSTITHSLGGTMTVTGNTSTYDLYLFNIPVEICIGLLSSANSWQLIRVGGGLTIAAFPISPSLATTECTAVPSAQILFRGT